MPMEERIVTKQQLRDACRRVRKNVSSEQKKERDRLICEKIAETAEFRRAKQVFLYVPISGEVDLIPLAKRCRKERKTIAFPVTDPLTDRLTFRTFRPGDQLSPGTYGIPEPPQDAPICAPDSHTLCILPGLCFDRQGNRLGQGKGCYDRFLATFSGISVGVVGNDLLFDEIPTDENDLPVSMIVTEQTVLRIATKGADGMVQPLRRSISRAGRKAKVLADRWHLTEYAEKGTRIVKQTAHDVWTHLFDKQIDRAEASEASETSGTSGTGETANRPQPSPTAKSSGVRAFAKPFPPILVAITFLLVRLSRIAQDNLSRRGSEYIGVMLLQVLIFLIPAVIYIRLRDERFPKRIKFKPLQTKHAWFLVCLLVMMVTGSLLISILTGGISSLTGNFTLYNTFLARSGGSAWETIYLILAFGVLPAFCEELVYRSILCAEYEQVCSEAAILVSTLFFAMLHFSFSLFPVYLWLGLLLAGAMYATRSVLAPMLLHLIYNLFCLFGQPYLSAFYVNAGSGELFIFCLMVLLLLFSAFASGEARKIFHRYARQEHADRDRTLPLKEICKRTTLSLATPAAALCLILWLIFS